MHRLVRSAAILTVLAAALAGCGNKEAVVTKAHTEGIYLDVGPLDYQVQISRFLNPAQVPDNAYLKGLGSTVSALQKGETWFGVFVRVQNSTDRTHPIATDVKITDTLGNEFQPVEIDANSNPFAYAPFDLQPEDTYPRPDSAAALDSAQGSLVLFRLPYTTLQNRPLEFHITSPEGDGEGIVDLDL